VAPGPTFHNPDPDTTPTERKHYPMPRRTLTLITAILLTLTLTIPAWGYGSDSGRIDCGSNNIAVHSSTRLDTYIQVPSGTTVAYKWFPDWTHYTKATSKQRPSWRVLSLDGQVNVAGTYAYCYGQ